MSLMSLFFDCKVTAISLTCKSHNWGIQHTIFMVLRSLRFAYIIGNGRKITCFAWFDQRKAKLFTTETNFNTVIMINKDVPAVPYYFQKACNDKTKVIFGGMLCSIR